VQLGEFVIQKTEEFVDWIVNTIQNIDWVGIGQDIVRSIGQGIADMGEWIGNQAEEHIADPIARKLSGNSPPPEGPLQNIDDDGRNLVETFAKGVNGTTGTAENAGNNIAGSMTPNMSTGNALDNPRVFMDGREVTSETGRYRQDETSRRGRNG
jgi:hypothetical protein